MRNESGRVGSRAGWLTPVLAAFLAVAASTGFARARDMSSDLGPLLNPVTRSIVDKGKKILQLDEDQVSVVQDLYSGYRSAYRAALDESDAKRRQIYDKAREANDWSGAEKQERELKKRTLADLDKLDANFMADARATLTADQDARFDTFERMRRREALRYMPLLSGDGADPSDIIDSLKIDRSKKPDLAAVLEEHEASLDRVLVAREHTLREGYAKHFESTDEQVLWTYFLKLFQSAKQVRDLNRQTARRIGEVLTEEDRTKFDEEFKKRSFPQIYRDTIISKRLKAARGLEDVTDSQKEQLEIIEQRYEKDSANANTAWRQALDRAHDAIAVDAGAAYNNGLDYGDLSEAVETRKKVDRQFLDKIDAVLRPEQVSRLPATTRDIPRTRSNPLPNWDYGDLRKWIKEEQ